MTSEKKREPIPEFRTIQEEAAFWDSHDLADYWDGFKPIEVHFAKNLSSSLNVRLDKESLQRLRAEAHVRGVGPSTLVRRWILEHLGTAPHENR